MLEKKLLAAACAATLLCVFEAATAAEQLYK